MRCVLAKTTTLNQVNTEARERRRSELKEAKLPPIKPRSEATQLPEDERREEINGTNEEEEALEDVNKTAEKPEETTKDKGQNKGGGKLGKFLSSFTKKQQPTRVIEENGVHQGNSESQETKSEEGSKDPSPEKTKKKVSFFRQFSQKKEQEKENKNPVDTTSNNAGKLDEKLPEQGVKDGQDKSTNDKDEDQDTLDDKEDSESEDSETENDEKEAISQTPGRLAPQKIAVSNSNHSIKPMPTTTYQGNGGNNRIKSKSCTIL